MRVSPGRRGSNSTCSDDRSALATAPSQRSPQLFPGPSIALSPAVPNVAKSLRPLIVDRRSSSSAPWSPSEYPRRAPRGGVYPSRPRRAPRRSLSEPTIHGTAIRLRGIATSRPPRRRCDPPREDRGPSPSSELSAKTAGPRHPGPTPSSELSAKTAGPRHPVSSPLDRRSSSALGISTSRPRRRRDPAPIEHASHEATTAQGPLQSESIQNDTPGLSSEPHDAPGRTPARAWASRHHATVSGLGLSFAAFSTSRPQTRRVASSTRHSLIAPATAPPKHITRRHIAPTRTTPRQCGDPLERADSRNGTGRLRTHLCSQAQSTDRSGKNRGRGVVSSIDSNNGSP